jgi:hypothetical protein
LPSGVSTKLTGCTAAKEYLPPGTDAIVLPHLGRSQDRTPQTDPAYRVFDPAQLSRLLSGYPNG